MIKMRIFITLIILIISFTSCGVKKPIKKDNINNTPITIILPDGIEIDSTTDVNSLVDSLISDGLIDIPIDSNKTNTNKTNTKKTKTKKKVKLKNNNITIVSGNDNKVDLDNSKDQKVKDNSKDNSKVKDNSKIKETKGSSWLIIIGITLLVFIIRVIRKYLKGRFGL